MKLKIGLDIHGVIDSCPELFKGLSQAMVDAGHEVHVLTGPRITPALRNELEAIGIRYTHIFSIVEHQEQSGVVIEWDEHGNPHLEPYLWDKTKAEYCDKHKIDLHLDDSDSYGYFFKTPYARFYSKDSQRIKKTKI